MSLNILVTADIKEISKTLLDIVKDEEKSHIKDMKTYLNKTNFSEEMKLDKYMEFSTSLFTAKITASLQTAQRYIISDKELGQSKLVNESQIKLLDAQADTAKQEKLLGIEKVALTKEQTAQVTEEVKAIKTKTFLSIIETEAKIDNTVASTLSEARKNGATVTNTERTYTDAGTGLIVKYSHISLAAAEVTDTTKGLIGLQMLQLKNQADTFKDHSKIQYGNQIMQLSSSALSEGLTAITGLLNTHKQLGVDLFGETIFDANYSTIA